jgi:hypothetical protein
MNFVGTAWVPTYFCCQRPAFAHETYANHGHFEDLWKAVYMRPIGVPMLKVVIGASSVNEFCRDRMGPDLLLLFE